MLKRPAQSPLIGKVKLGRRRIVTPLRRVQTQLTFADSDIGSELDSDDDFWDSYSIDREIMSVRTSMENLLITQISFKQLYCHTIL